MLHDIYQVEMSAILYVEIYQKQIKNSRITDRCSVKILNIKDFQF